MSRHVYGWMLGSVATLGVLTSSNGFGQQNQPKEPVRREPSRAIERAGEVVQRTGQAINEVAGGQRDQGTQQQIDSEIASCLILANQNEVALAKLAQEKAHSDEVKQFAKMLEQEHTQMIATLAKFTNDNHKNRDTTRTTAAAATPREIREERTELRAGEGTGVQAEVRDGQGTRVGADVNIKVGGNAGQQHSAVQQVQHQIQQEIADQCLSDSKKELNAKESYKFDECFVGMQIGGHMKMHSELAVLTRHSSANLQTALSTAQQTTDKHLEEAKSLMEKLAKNNKQ